jgi:hypothetical protein
MPDRRSCQNPHGVAGLEDRLFSQSEDDPDELLAVGGRKE